MAQDISKMETTAVELLEKLYKEGILIHKSFEIAKTMEKQQIQKSFSDGQELSITNPLLPHYSSEEYYKDNYGCKDLLHMQTTKASCQKQ